MINVWPSEALKARRYHSQLQAEGAASGNMRTHSFSPEGAAKPLIGLKILFFDAKDAKGAKVAKTSLVT